MKSRRQESVQWKERERYIKKLQQQKILKYERKLKQALKLAQEKPLRHSQSRSSSKSPSPHQHRGRSTSNSSNTSTLYEKLDGSSSAAVPLFKDPQGTQISTTKLRQIKINIRRNIPAKGPVSELQRDIVNPEDVLLKRREKEGCKPIFDRKEIKEAIIKTNEVEKRCSVAATDKKQSVSTSKLQTSRKRSSSLSPTRNHGYNSGYLSSYQSSKNNLEKLREHKERYTEIDVNKCDINRSREQDPCTSNSRRNSVEKRREYKERYTERDANKYDTNRSRTRERDPCTSNSRSFMEDRAYRDRSEHERSSERSREKRDRARDRDRSREPRDVTPHYIEPVHVPIYYGSFPPEPIVVNPMVPFRGQVPPMGRGRHPGLMAPVRPFSPRFIPPNMYRFGPPPPNPRYGPY